MKVLITGAAGFIGGALSLKLAQRGDRVFGIDVLSSYYDVSLKQARLDRLSSFSNFSFEKLDIADKSAVDRVFSEFKPDRVVNLAAQAGVRYSLTNPDVYIDSNIVGFLNILEGCRHNGVEHLVFASSSSVYGANEIPFSVKDPVDHPVSLYAATKKSNEMMAHSYSHLYGLPTTGLRFFTVYGPWGRPDMALFLFTKNILNGEPIELFNYGKHRRDFTYIDDIVEGVTRVLDKPAASNPNWSSKLADPGTSLAPYRIYNIGNHESVWLDEFVEAIEAALGMKATRKEVPMQAGDVKETFADVDRLYEDFGFRPKTSIRDGVKQFVDWYRDYFHPPKQERPAKERELQL